MAELEPIKMSDDEWFLILHTPFGPWAIFIFSSSESFRDWLGKCYQRLSIQKDSFSISDWGNATKTQRTPLPDYITKELGIEDTND